MTIKHLLFKIIFFLILPIHAHSYPRQTKVFKEGRVTTGSFIESFSTDNNYDENGESKALSEIGSNFVNTSLDMYSRYSFSQDWAAYGLINLSGSESNDGTLVRSNSGASYMKAGLDYSILNGWIDLIGTGEIQIPFSRIEETTDAVITHEGTTDFTGTIQLQKLSKSNLSYLWAGFSYRDDGRSALIPYGVGTQFQIKKIIFGGELKGSMSAIEDTNQSRYLVTERVNAGSLKFYSTNPSVIDLEGILKYKFSNSVSLGGGFGTTIAGANSAAGQYFFIGMDITWQAYSRAGTSSKQDKYLREFREATEDGVDQNLFEDEDLTQELR